MAYPVRGRDPGSALTLSRGRSASSARKFPRPLRATAKTGRFPPAWPSGLGPWERGVLPRPLGQWPGQELRGSPFECNDVSAGRCGPPHGSTRSGDQLLACCSDIESERTSRASAGGKCVSPRSVRGSTGQPHQRMVGLARVLLSLRLPANAGPHFERCRFPVQVLNHD